MMSVSPLQLRVGLTSCNGLTGRDLTALLPPIFVLQCMEAPVAVTGGYFAGKVWCGESQASTGEDGLHPEHVQEILWRQFFADPRQWWDNRRSSSRHPDFRHKKSKVALWLSNRYKPAWVDSQLAKWDARVNKGPAEAFVSTSVRARGAFAAHEAHLEVGICRKLCEDGRTVDAVDALDLLVQRGCHVPNNLFYRVLKRCIAQKNLVLGRRIHALTVKNGYDGHAFLATHLIGLYASHGQLEEAMKVFAKVTTPDSYNWATIIFAYARHGQPRQAIQLYWQMREVAIQPDNHVFLAVLKACATARDLDAGKDVHAHVLASARKPDIFVQNCLVDMYAKCGSIEDARSVFDSLPQKDVVTWTAMIAGYAQQEMGQEALSIYRMMQQGGIAPPDSVTFVCLLQACASVGVEGLHPGKQLHAQIDERGLHYDTTLGGSLVNMYAKCGSIEDAHRVFDRLHHRSVVTWTAMMSGYVQQGLGQEALSLYNSMQQEGNASPNSITFVCLVQACINVGEAALHQGKQIHTQIEERGLQDNMVIGASLVNMYAKFGSIEDARRLFDKLSEKDLVTWTAMITGYAQLGLGQEALSFYDNMQQEGIFPPDSVTFVSLLQACATVAALPLGKHLHAQILERGLQADMVVGTGLVNMYAKCGNMSSSQQVFDSLPEKSIEAWSALIAGYARQGSSDVVFYLVDRMSQEGVQPNDFTFLSVMTVCSHVGLLDQGRKYFEAMRTDYGISPTINHYTCMMDLLGRAGHLDEALQMAKTMPFPANSSVWVTLLSACQKWNNVGIGRQAFEFAVSLDETVSSSYVLMANIYAGANMLQEAREVQGRRLKSKAWKQPGQTWWTDTGGVVHMFGVSENPEFEDTFAGLV